MGDTVRPEISRDTKELIDEEKPEGTTYDFYIRFCVENSPEMEEVLNV